MTWRDEAACRPDNRPSDVTPAEWTAIFYPVPETPVGRPKRNPDLAAMYAPARAICSQCPVTEQCLHAAMVEETGVLRRGMRGGLTWRERGALPRRTCRWCTKWFPVTPISSRGGRHPRYCGDQCRDAARAETMRQELERQRVARWTDDPTVCEVCGFEARTTSGLAAHRRNLHGKAVA